MIDLGTTLHLNKKDFGCTLKVLFLLFYWCYRVMALYSSREILPNLGNIGQSDPIGYLAQNKQLRNPNLEIGENLILKLFYLSL